MTLEEKARLRLPRSTGGKDIIRDVITNPILHMLAEAFGVPADSLVVAEAAMRKRGMSPDDPDLIKNVGFWATAAKLSRQAVDLSIRTEGVSLGDAFEAMDRAMKLADELEIPKMNLPPKGGDRLCLRQEDGTLATEFWLTVKKIGIQPSLIRGLWWIFDEEGTDLYLCRNSHEKTSEVFPIRGIVVWEEVDHNEYEELVRREVIPKNDAKPLTVAIDMGTALVMDSNLRTLLSEMQGVFLDIEKMLRSADHIHALSMSDVWLSALEYKINHLVGQFIICQDILRGYDASKKS